MTQGRFAYAAPGRRKRQSPCRFAALRCSGDPRSDRGVVVASGSAPPRGPTTAMSRIFVPHASACVFLLVALLAGSAGAQSAEEIRAELERQQALLDQAQLASEEELEEEGGSREPADPRVAPKAPIDRKLPIAIFDTVSVRVPANTWNNPERLELERRLLDADGDGRGNTDRPNGRQIRCGREEG